MRKHNISYYNTGLKSFLAALIWPLLSTSQPSPLHIGDTIPNIHLTNLINYKSPSADLSDFNDKLIILDFWATWCSSCFKKLSRLDSLQEQFGQEIKILLVSSRSTGDDSAKVAAFFSKRRNAQGLPFCLPSVVNDTLLDKLFPHVVVPHYIWIYKNKLIAITASDEITTANITAVLSNQPFCFSIKDDSLRPKKQLTKNQ